jgi:pyruvate/2-oxoglutarate dehydrogenase complex dihydrolipoamide dehydrogenase (E3) component
MMERKRRVVSGMVDAHRNLFSSTPHLEFVEGEARLVEPHVVEVRTRDGQTRRLRGERIFLNLGARPRRPDIAGLDSVSYLTSEDALQLEKAPEHLLVVGGGYISLEFAQIFLRAGSRVTILERVERFLPREDRDIAERILEILDAEGLQRLDGCNFRSVTQDGSGIQIHLDRQGQSCVVEGSHLLVAVGRQPNTDGIGLQEAGLKLDSRGFVSVNHRLETNLEGHWALGDCNGGPMFTHASWDDFRIVRDNVFLGKERSRDGRQMPYTLFTDPELGRVGLNEDEALALGRPLLRAKLDAQKIPRAQTNGETAGLLKAVIDASSHQILGCSLLCCNAGEVASVVQMAMLGNIPYTQVRDTVFSHPTMAEGLNLLFSQVQPLLR